jgi:hypothetical protein
MPSGCVPFREELGLKLHSLTSLWSHWWEWAELHGQFYVCLYQQYFFGDAFMQMGRKLLICLTLTLDVSRFSIFSIACRFWTGRTGVGFLVGENGFSLVRKVRIISGAHPASCFMGTGHKGAGTLSESPASLSRLRMGGAVHLLLLYTFMTWTGLHCSGWKRLRYSLDKRLHSSESCGECANVIQSRVCWMLHFLLLFLSQLN